MTRKGVILFVCCIVGANAWADDGPTHVIGPPPADRGLSPFYKKSIMLRDFPIVSSDKVSDYALKEAAFLVEKMLVDRHEVLDEMARNKVRLAIMAYSERTSDVPEHSDLEPKKYWDRRARGLGATHARPAVSGEEENLLGYPGDPYATENILMAAVLAEAGTAEVAAAGLRAPRPA